METKRCIKCGIDKNLCEFAKSSSAKSGLRGSCRSCQAIYFAKRYQNNKDEVQAKGKSYRTNNRAKILQQKRRYYYSHRIEILSKQAAARPANKKRHNAYNSNWRKENPDKVRAQKDRRRARKFGGGGSYTSKDIQRQGILQNWVCWWQGTDCQGYCKDNYHIDHIIPLRRGGHNNPSNIVISCPICNLQKGTKLPIEWIGRLF